MNPTVALPGSMTWMGIRLSSGSHPQSPKGLPPRKRCETYESVRFFTTAILSGARFKRYLRYTHPRLPERQLWHGPPAPGSLYDCKDRRTKGPPQIGGRPTGQREAAHRRKIDRQGTAGLASGRRFVLRGGHLREAQREVLRDAR